MGVVYFIAAGALLMNVLAGLVRIMLGPSSADRMLAAQLMGTTGVAVLLLLGQAMDIPAARDVALVLAALAAVAVVAFVRRTWRGAPEAAAPGDGSQGEIRGAEA